MEKKVVEVKIEERLLLNLSFKRPRIKLIKCLREMKISNVFGIFRLCNAVKIITGFQSNNCLNRR